MSDIPTGPSPESPAGTAAEEEVTRIFLGHRELLFSIVYNMLGSAADTEDMLQETWMAWAPRSRAPSGEQIANPRAYLVRIAVNRALARQATPRSRSSSWSSPPTAARSAGSTR